MGYDGIVLESWSRWAGYGVLHDPELRIMVNATLASFLCYLEGCSQGSPFVLKN